MISKDSIAEITGTRSIAKHTFEKMKLVEKIPLENGLTAEVWEFSRPIAADVTKVGLLLRTRVPLRREDFVHPDQYRKTCAAFGNELLFDCRKERSFVRNHDVASVTHDLRDDFQKNVVSYLSLPCFPRRFALSKYREIEQNPYRYQNILKEK